ncbi:hypothetical protein [Sulfurimonas sp.]|uniref:hypothetical protein n=1 Tax=Sulfurimonas sp. TaxID=2022749 RepID=UPI002AB1939A|nr:hypothetical protein [Sulfurimonas sp.]
MIYIKTLLITWVLIFGFTGCVSKDTKQLLSKYAIASTEAQRNIIFTYEDTLENSQKAKYYKAVRDGATVKDLQSVKIDYSGQIKTLNDLVSFSESMIAITGDSFNNKIDENSAKLYESAKNLSENKAVSHNVSNEDLQLFATLVNGAFRGYSEYIRAKKLKELILVADKWVQPSINSLDKDLNHWKKILKRSLYKQKNIKIMILNKPHTYCQIKDATKKCIPLAETFKTKVDMYEDIALLQKRLDNLDKEFESLSNSIITMSKLHKNVIISLKRDEINKEELSKIFYDLKEHVDSIKEFRDSIKKEQ